MRQVLLRTAALFRRPWVLVASLLLAAGGSALVAVPLFGLPGFELSLSLSIAVGLLGGGIGVASALQERNLVRGRDPRPKGALRSDSALTTSLQAIAAAFVLCVLSLLPPFLVSTGFALFSTECSPFVHVAFFPLLTLPSALLASATGVLTGFASRSGWSGVLRFVALVVLSLVFTVWPVFAGPQVFAFNHFLGYFPGPLYDEALSVPSALYIFRGETLLLTAFVWLLVAFFLDMREGSLGRPQLRPGAFALLGAVGFAIFALETRASQLGLRMTDAALAERLGGKRETPHFLIHYPRGKPRLEVDRLERDLEFQFARTQTFLGTAPKERIRVYVYRTPEEKRQLVGASRTQFAKPWRNEFHLNDADFPHAVLRHELVHVMAAPLAPAPFHVTSRLLGLWPHMGVIEGVAVAVEDSAEELTLHEWAAGMRRQKLAPDIRDVLGNRGFYAQSAARSYTLAGSFLRYLAQHYGQQKLQAFYRHGAFEEVYGRSLDAVATEWETFIDALPLDEAAVHQAFARFRRGPLFARPCAREVALLESEARALIAADPERAAELYQRCRALQPEEPSHAIGEARSLAELGKLDEAAQLLASLREKVSGHPALEAQARMEEANVAVSRQKLEEARAQLLAILALQPSPMVERTAHVKLAALASPDIGPAIWSYFREGHEDVRLLRLRDALERAPDDAYVPYLLGRRLTGSSVPALALPHLARAIGGGLPDIIRREALRLDVEAHYLAGDCAGVRNRVGALPDLGQAFLQDAREWVARCDFEEKHFAGPLVPANAFR